MLTAGGALSVSEVLLGGVVALGCAARTASALTAAEADSAFVDAGPRLHQYAPSATTTEISATSQPRRVGAPVGVGAAGR